MDWRETKTNFILNCLCIFSHKVEIEQKKRYLKGNKICYSPWPDNP